MIPKEKMALLIAGIKPKAHNGDEGDYDKDEASEKDEGYSFADCLWKALAAFQQHDREAFDDHAADLQDILRGEDEKQDAEDAEEE